MWIVNQKTTLEDIVPDKVESLVCVGLAVPILDLVDGAKDAGLVRVLVQVEVLMDPRGESHGCKLCLVGSHLEVSRKVWDEGELSFETFLGLASGGVQQEDEISRNKVTF